MRGLSWKCARGGVRGDRAARRGAGEGGLRARMCGGEAGDLGIHVEELCLEMVNGSGPVHFQFGQGLVHFGHDLLSLGNCEI